MKLVDKFDCAIRFRQRVEWMLLMTLLLFSATAIEAGTFKIDLEGCRAGSGNGYHLEQVLGQGGLYVPMYVCNDTAYTDGNLNTWAELDMVPHRLIFENTTGAPVDFNFTVGGDYIDTNDPNLIGWDYITELTLDVNASDPICQTMVDDFVVQTLQIDGENLHRHVTVTSFPDDTTCIADYNMRLAIGSSGYSGSSLQDYLLEGGGKQTLPLPAVTATTFNKTMSAVQGGSRNWTVTKSSTPSQINFEDTCAVTPVLSKDVNITVSWTKGAVTPAGNVEVVTQILASNTASRDINISVVDTLYSGTTVLSTENCGPITLLADVGEHLVCTNTYLIPEGDAVDLNDKAIATYIDPDYPPTAFPGAEILQTKEATASAVVQGSGVNTDENATIKDHEWIFGNDLNYSSDSFTPDIGAFDNGYIAGTETHGDVNWTSDVQTDSGSVTFSKTVYANAATAATGTLSDRATLIGSDGFVATDAPLNISLSSSALVEITIVKTIDDLIIADDVALDFNFTVRNEMGFNQTFTIHFDAGDTNTSKSITITGLDPALYEVKEVAIPGYEPVGEATKTIDLNLPTCRGTVTFDNTVADRPVVKVAKITDPAFISAVDQAADWNMTLYKETNVTGVWQMVNSVLTTSGGVFEVLESNLTKGSYKIEETLKAGWYIAGIDEDCTFTYDPADGNRSDYECIFYNRKYATIIINKVTDPSPNVSTVFSFTQDINSSIPLSLGDGDTQVYQKLTNGTYHVTENDPAPDFDLTSLVCTESGIDNNNTVTVTNLNLRQAKIELDSGETVECTFTNTERGTINVLKLEDGTTTTEFWTFTLEGPEGIMERNTSTSLNFEDARLIPDQNYTLCEIDIHTGWSADWIFNTVTVVPYTRDRNGTIDRCYDFTVSAGEEAAFVIDNISPPAALHLGDYVWYDDNNNGIQDSGEDPVEGLKVELLDESGALITDLYNKDTLYTDVNGSYDFYVEEGNYSIRFSGLPVNYVFAPTKMGTDNSVDSDANSNGVTDVVSVSTTANYDLDAGIYCLCNDIQSNSSPAMNQISAALMILITMMLGLFFIRKEEQLNRDKR